MKRTICIAIAALFCCVCAEAQNLKLRTVVIDPGHGGKDPGAVSRDGKTYEKNLALDISRRLRDCIIEEFPDVKVIMTRDSDIYVEHEKRASIANKANADLFISIHINSVKSASANGYSVHLLGQSSDKNKDLFASNLEVCKRENSVIMLEDDYQTKYQGFDPSDPESFIFMQMMQSSHLESSMIFGQEVSIALHDSPLKNDRGIWQAPFWVLWRTAMPSALIELGFISNNEDLRILRSETHRQEIAVSLLKAFARYKSIYDGSMEFDPNGTATVSTGLIGLVEPVGESVAKEEKVEALQTEIAVKPEVTAKAEVSYGIQIFAGSRKLDSRDRQFLGYVPVVIPSGVLFKYIIAVSDSEDEARSHMAEIRKKYPQCFLVKIEGETASPVKR